MLAAAVKLMATVYEYAGSDANLLSCLHPFQILCTVYSLSATSCVSKCRGSMLAVQYCLNTVLHTVPKPFFKEQGMAFAVKNFVKKHGS